MAFLFPQEYLHAIHDRGAIDGEDMTIDGVNFYYSGGFYFALYMEFGFRNWIAGYIHISCGYQLQGIGYRNPNMYPGNLNPSI